MRFQHFDKRFWLYLPWNNCLRFEFGRVKELRWIDFSWGMDHTEGVQLSAGFGYGFWLTWELPWSWMRLLHFPKSEREFSLRWYVDNLHLSLFSDDWGASIGASNNRHRWTLWDNDWITGRDKYSKLVLWNGTGVVNVGQWDGDEYTVDVEFSKSIWRNRFRTKERYGFWMDAQKGQYPIVPGKGENSWDIGDDAILGTGFDDGTILEALEHYAEAVRSTRLRHGGPNWRPAKAKTP